MKKANRVPKVRTPDDGTRDVGRSDVANPRMTEVWVAISLPQVIVSTSIAGISRGTGIPYSTLKKRTKNYSLVKDFDIIRPKGGYIWYIKRVDMIRIVGRGGKRDKGVSAKGFLGYKK